MIYRTHHRTSQRGQALIETTIVISLLLLFLMGTFAVSGFANVKNQAIGSVRAGTRLAAELGNNNYQAGGSKNPTSLDQQIVQATLQTAKLIPYVSTIYEVDVYQPTATNGDYVPGTDLIDCYDNTGAVLTCAPPAAGKYTLDLRTQVHPFEALIGVRIRYHFLSPTPIYTLSVDTTDYAVMRLAPRFT